MPTITQIEEAIISTIDGLNLFATLQSAGRKELPEVYAYPACFVFFDGDKALQSLPRPIDELTFSVAIQVQNLSLEQEAARNAYGLNDLVRAVIRNKTLGLPDIEQFTCASRHCSSYDDSEGVLEYTHTYTTRLYQN
jgi:hypothetical protein